jgi:predicted ferric reductase
VFYVRPVGGFTARLAKLAEGGGRTISVSIDGPYGKNDIASTLAEHENTLFIASGSGAGLASYT